MQVTQEPKFLSQMLGELEAGRIVPAAMQRPYVWCEADVLAFCESLVDALPIGSLLTWRPGPGIRTEAVGRSRIGPVRIEGAQTRARLVLDGQNRLATFAWMLGGDMPDDLSEAEIATWKNQQLVIDRDAGGFLFVPRGAAETGLRMPSTAIASRQFQRHLRLSWNRWEAEGFSTHECEDFVALISRIDDRVREARVVETIIDGGTPEEAKSIFLRICRTGVPMSGEDFDAALSWLPDAC